MGFEGVVSILWRLFPVREPIGTHRIDNLIRPVALGRKDYLFAGSHEGANRLAMVYTCFATCKPNRITPLRWLHAVLQRMPDHPVHKLLELLPLPKKTGSGYTGFSGWIPLNNGVPEGIHNSIQLADRIARGYRNPGNFHHMIHFLAGDLRFDHLLLTIYSQKSLIGTVRQT
jgi:IS66 C-terminal element/Transposase